MSDVVIYHNPNCGTSRNTLALLREKGIEPKVVEYLKTGWTREQLQDLLTRMMDENSRAPEPVGAFPHARRVGDFLFLSGMGPRKRGSKEIPGVTLDASGTIAAYDIEVQTRAVFENVRTVLEASGSKWENLVDVTVYLTNMKRDFALYNTLWAEYFHTNPPCRTTVEILSLPTPIAIELKCIATVD